MNTKLFFTFLGGVAMRELIVVFLIVLMVTTIPLWFFFGSFEKNFKSIIPAIKLCRDSFDQAFLKSLKKKQVNK